MSQPLPSATAVQQWMRTINGFDRAIVRHIHAFEGGASNITCRVDLDAAPAAAVVLRVQRDRGIFEPYDVLREGRVLERLAHSDVPVPAVIGSEPDPAVLGAPFIVLQWVDAPHMGEAGAEGSFETYTRTVAAVHSVDWRGIGLGFLGVPASVSDGLRAELDAVEARMARFQGGDDPLLVRAVERLRGVVPSDGTLALCQGDINVFNYLVRGGEVVAVVDWEQARISDARSDVGQLVALAHLKGVPFCPAGEAPFVKSYEAVSGRALPNMAWFRARWLWELGVIYFGWKAFNTSDPWYSWDDVQRLLGAALAEL
jgi:aminoglycoside phosphotransferase (APT) family kinase protein